MWLELRLRMTMARILRIVPEVNYIYLSAHQRLHSGPLDLARPIARVSDYEGGPQAYAGSKRPEGGG